MTMLLVVTVGQTDVQLVVDGVRHELGKRCAALHDELERRTGSWGLVDSPDEKAVTVIDKLPDGELALCTPKVDAVLHHLDRVAPKAALILETRRDANAWAGDPRFAGKLLEVRLRDAGVDTIHRVAYLEGAEHLEDRGQPRDAVIRREVVRRIHEAVRESLAASTPSRVIVANTGGFPVVGNLVEEIVRLYASTPVDALEVADGATTNPPTADRAVPRTSVSEPLLSFQGRRRALELVTEGNLLGAWAIAKPLHDEEAERGWTQVVEWLACFAASLPMPPSCDIPVLTHKRMAVRAALRVELALRGGDIPRAIHGTVAFFEAALWDHLGERATGHRDPTKRRLFRLDPVPADDLVGKGCPFTLKKMPDGTNWYKIDDRMESASKIAARYLNRDALTKLGQAVAGEVRELRNDVAHNEPTSERMEGARRCMIEAALWSPQDTFLSQPLVQDVLRELGQDDPGALLTNLLQMIRDRLIVAPRP